jgi:hypothetical protein
VSPNSHLPTDAAPCRNIFPRPPMKHGAGLGHVETQQRSVTVRAFQSNLELSCCWQLTFPTGNYYSCPLGK